MKALWIEQVSDRDLTDLYPKIVTAGFTDVVILCQKASTRFDSDIPEALSTFDALGVKVHLAVNLCKVHYYNEADYQYAQSGEFFDIADPIHRAHMVGFVTDLARRYERPIHLDYIRGGVKGLDKDYEQRNAMFVLAVQLAESTGVELSIATFPTLMDTYPNETARGIDPVRLLNTPISWGFSMHYLYPGHQVWPKIHSLIQADLALGPYYPLGTCYARDPDARSLTKDEFTSVIAALEAYDNYGIYSHVHFTDEQAEVMAEWR